MTRVRRRCLLLASATLCLSACGGGAGGGIASTPPPPVTPPPPASDKPIPPPHLGLVSAAPFAVLGEGDTYTADANGKYVSTVSGPAPQNIQFSYDPATNSYMISLPGFSPGTLGETGYNGSAGQPATSSTSKVLELAFGIPQPVGVFLPVPGRALSAYTYTSYGYWTGQTAVTQTGQTRSEGIFVYGIPTAVGNVPTTGSASYDARILASTGPGNSPPDVGGTASLSFNFAAGTLSGSMHPIIDQDFNGTIDFGQYDFKNTVYSTGSTTFSGQFVVPNLPNAVSFFNGNFTGPGAAELMARFQAPFIYGDGQQGMLSGVWIGKKN